MNYRLLTGAFEGMVIEEGLDILDIPFSELNLDLQERIKYHAGLDDDDDFPSEKEGEDAKESYEKSWDTYETDEKVNLIPISEW